MSEYDPFTRHVAKNQMRGHNNIPITQSLFIEHLYSGNKFAVYSWGDEDKEYEGVIYPSLKLLYLGMGDITGYQFATTHLLNWKHWIRLQESDYLAPHFQEWRDELEIKMKCDAIDLIREQSEAEGKGFQAAKWLAEGGWDKRKAGRPSKAEIEHKTNINKRIQEEFEGDVTRMDKYRKKK